MTSLTRSSFLFLFDLNWVNMRLLDDKMIAFIDGPHLLRIMQFEDLVVSVFSSVCISTS